MRSTSLALALALVATAASPALAAPKPAVTWEPAAPGHFTRGRSQKIDMVVIHTVEGSQASAVATFRGPRLVSAHYVVGKDGSIVQCVADADTAWHAGSANGHSIGIEHEGFDTRPGNYTEAQYAASAQLTRWLCDAYKIPIDRKHIVGHSEIPGQDHGDPGRYWDWPRYMQLVLRAHPLPPVRGGVAPVASSNGSVAPVASNVGGLANPGGIPVQPVSGSSSTATNPSSTNPSSTNPATTTTPSSTTPSSTTPASTGTTATAGKNTDDGIPAPVATKGGTSASSNGATAPATTASTGSSASTKTPSPNESGNDPGALMSNELAGIVKTLDKAFETLEGTIAAVESAAEASVAKGNTAPVSSASTPAATTPAATTPAASLPEPLCAQGSTGDAVRRIQQQLGITADGIYGPETEAAVRAFQAAHGCKVDGIVGPETWGALDHAAGRTPSTTASASTPGSGTTSHTPNTGTVSRGSSSHGSSSSSSSHATSPGAASTGSSHSTPASSTSSSSASDDGIPAPSPASTSTSSGQVCQPGDYSAQDGDTFASVAAKLGVSETDLANANPQITACGPLKAGDVVHVPGASH